MKKILNVQPGRLEGTVVFEYNEKVVSSNEGVNEDPLVKTLKKECSGKGVLVYMDLDQFQEYQKIENGTAIIVPTERYENLRKKGKNKRY
jgi:hypothetical protein